MKELRRNYLYIILLLFAVLIIPKKASALPLCTAKIKQQYITAAEKIKFSYEFIREDESYYFQIKATNTDKNLIIEYNNYDYNGLGNDDYIVFDTHFKDNAIYKFKIKVREGITCADETITYRTVKIPKFNKYSEYDECIEYEEAPICSRFYQGKIENIEDFRKQLKDYLAKIKEKQIEDYKDERSLFQKISDFYMDHVIICGTLTFIVFAVIIALILKKFAKKKKRIKL